MIMIREDSSNYVKDAVVHTALIYSAHSLGSVEDIFGKEEKHISME